MNNSKAQLPNRSAIWASAFLLNLGTLSRADEVKPPEPPKKWETVASIGLTLTRGNSENFLANASINSNRKFAKNEILLGASAGYGETTTRKSGPDETDTTENYVKGFGQWNHLFTERLYSGLRLDAMHDDIADID